MFHVNIRERRARVRDPRKGREHPARFCFKRSSPVGRARGATFATSSVSAAGVTAHRLAGMADGARPMGDQFLA